MTSGAAAAIDGYPGRPRAILLGDAHPLFRSGMGHMLQDALGPAEIVEAGGRSELLTLLERGSFDLVLSSLFSVEGDWGDFLADLLQRAPAGRLMILSSVDEPTRILRILRAGAAGFVLKETPPNITLHAVRLVLDGGIYIPPAALRALSGDGAADAVAFSEAPDPAPADDIPLTERQRAVLSLIVQGASNKAIARSLDLSAGTVKGHVANLFRLFGVENRMELVHAATRRGGLTARESREPEGSEPRRPS